MKKKRTKIQKLRATNSGQKRATKSQKRLFSRTGKFYRNGHKRLDRYGKTLRHVGRRNVRVPALVSTAQHRIAVKTGKGWQLLGAFRSEVLARDYGQALKRAYPKRDIAYFSPGESLVESYKKNPATPAASFAVAQDVNAAARRYARFTGHRVGNMKRVTLPQAKAAFAVGPMLGVAYETTRGGKREKYLHEFRPNARPLLAVSSDGRSLFALGGAYTFTDRGFVDRKSRRKR